MKTLRLRIESRGLLGVPRTMHFERFPVLIGRDESSECRLDLSFVSRRHARLELHNERLMLRDEGSQVGTRVLSGKTVLPPMELVDLAQFDNEFQIGFLRFHADLFDKKAKEETANEHIVTVRAAADMATVSGSSRLDPCALDDRALDESLRDALEKHRKACDALVALLTKASVEASSRTLPFARTIVEADPYWDAHSTVRLFVEKSGLQPAPTRVDTTSLHLLQGLAGFYVPHAPPPTDIETVSAFVERLDATLSVLLDGIAALRFAYKNETDIEPPDDAHRRQLAAQLLDWTSDRAFLDRLSNELAEMTTHHRRLVTEATGGLEQVLASLRPSSIEQACSLPSRWNPFRYRVLWNEFVRRYHEVHGQRTQALGRTFATVAEALGMTVGRQSVEHTDRRISLDAEFSPAARVPVEGAPMPLASC